MSRVKLTNGRIRDFNTNKGQSFLWDTDVPGLAVRATAGGIRKPEGNKAYIFQSILSNGQEPRITIGNVGIWSIEEAREEARTLQKLIDTGQDPREVKRKDLAVEVANRNESKRAETPAIEAWHCYIDARRGKWSERHAADHESVCGAGGKHRTRGRRSGESDITQPGPLHAILLLPLKEIDADRIREWLKGEVARRPTQAALVFRLLRAFINWCSDQSEYRNQIHRDACTSRSVKDELVKSKPKNDALQREQLAGWFDAVKKIENPVIATYLQLLLLIGPRPGELKKLQWKDVDFQWKTLRFGGLKSPRTVPLTPYVENLLASLPRRSTWVFDSPSAGAGHLIDPSRAHTNACTIANVEITEHGLRRSFASLSEWVEVPAGIGAQIQGHTPQGVREKHYIRRPIDLLRKWHIKIESWILKEAKIEIIAAPAGLRVITKNQKGNK